MALRDSFQRVLSEYAGAMREPFTNHPLAAFLRNDLPEQIRALIEDAGDYIVRGSAGQSQWARSPWVAILDSDVTDSAQSGYYPVYLFSANFSGLYFSLNQGVTDLEEKYGSKKVKDVLTLRASDFRARIGERPERFLLEEIDLHPESQSDYAAKYEAGNIYARFYPANGLPDEAELMLDLREMLSVYSTLSYGENVPTGTIGVEDDEQNNEYIEDYAKFRQHKRIERNPKLARKVKEVLGYLCQVCNFSFEEFYAGIPQRRYIEAHHLVPIAELKGKRVSRDPEKDFAVLCANCHRMIHRFEAPWDLDRFRKAMRDKDSSQE